MSSGSCVAGGYYGTGDDNYTGVYVLLTNGVWGEAIPIPGQPFFAENSDAEVHDLSCTTAGSCVGGGYFVTDGVEETEDAYLFEFPLLPGGAVQGVDPARLVDSRVGPDFVTVDGEFEGFGRIAAGATTEFQVAGRGDVPDTAGAALLNVISSAPAGSGYVTVWDCVGDAPTASNVNHVPEADTSNAVLTDLGSDGEVCVFSTTAYDLVVDVNGYVPQVGALLAVAPARLVETRVGPGFETADGASQGIGRRLPGSTLGFRVAIGADGPSYLTVWDCDGSPPLASSVNFAPGVDRANAALIELSEGGNACVFTPVGVDIAVDVNGYTPSLSSLDGVLPARLVDSRAGSGFDTVDDQSQGFGQVAAGSVTEFQVAGRGGVGPTAGVALLNVAAAAPAGSGYLTIWDCDGDPPLSSNVNYVAGNDASTLVLASLGTDGEACVFAFAATDLVVDVTSFGR